MLETLYLFFLAFLLSVILHFVIQFFARISKNRSARVSKMKLQDRKNRVYSDHHDILILIPPAILVILLSDMRGEVEMNWTYFFCVLGLLVVVYLMFQLNLGREDEEGDL